MFGKSLIIDIKTDKKNEKFLMDVEYMREFATSLVYAINMNIHQIDNKDALIIDKWGSDILFGVSCCVLINESNISFHTTMETETTPPTLFLDIFSCMDFTSTDVINHIEKYFKIVLISRLIEIVRD